MHIKPLHLVILIGILAGIIIYIYMKLNRVEIDLAILKKKIENNQHLESTKKIEDKSKKSISLSSSDSLSISDKSSKKERKQSLKKELPNNNIFKTLGIPNIFDIFNVSNIENLKNMDKFTTHPQFKNLESSDTEDIETSTTISIKRESSPKIIVSNIEIKKDETINNQLIESDFKGNIEPNISIQNSVINTEDIHKVINNDEEMDKTEIDNNDNIETYSNSENKSEKSNLEKLKVNELKEMAKKKNINIFNGKKLKNKTELINDILKS